MEKATPVFLPGEFHERGAWWAAVHGVTQSQTQLKWLSSSRTWKQPRCPLTDQWIKKLWSLHTMEYYSAIKRNAFESVLMKWMNLEPIIQSEVSQKEKDKYCTLLHICGNLEKWYWRIYLEGSNGETDIKKRLMDMGKGEKRVRCMERVTGKLTLLYVK